MAKLPGSGSGQNDSNPLLSKTIASVDTLLSLYKASQGLRYLQGHQFLTDLRRTIEGIARESTAVSFLAIELTEFSRVFPLKKVKQTHFTRMELNIEHTYNRLLTLRRTLRKWPPAKPLPTVLRVGRTGIQFGVPDWRAILIKKESHRESDDPLELFRSFLEEPDRSMDLDDKLNAWAESSNIAPKKFRRIVAKMVQALVGPTELALHHLERNSGKGFIVKLPLEWTELQSILNSVSERTLLLFKTARESYFMIVPGSAFREAKGALFDPFATAIRTFASLYADAVGHSHPRGTDAEPTEMDQVSDFIENFKTADQFILVLLEKNVLEMSFQNAGQKDYRLVRDREAIEEVVRRGWLRGRGSLKIPSESIPSVRALAIQA